MWESKARDSEHWSCPGAGRGTLASLVSTHHSQQPGSSLPAGRGFPAAASSHEGRGLWKVSQARLGPMRPLWAHWPPGSTQDHSCVPPSVPTPHRTTLAPHPLQPHHAGHPPCPHHTGPPLHPTLCTHTTQVSLYPLVSLSLRSEGSQLHSHRCVHDWLGGQLHRPPHFLLVTGQLSLSFSCPGPPRAWCCPALAWAQYRPWRSARPGTQPCRVLS